MLHLPSVWKARKDRDPLSDHQRSHNDEGTTGGPRWDGSKDRGEKDRDEEHQTHHDGGDTCLATLWSGHVSFTQK